jgi:predicted phosphohydrolase
VKVFAIADLHLPGGLNKTMDVFGPDWQGHAARIALDWDARVGPDDLVLVAGDTSWAMRLREAQADLAWVADRPGRKVIIRGNHDYWWQSLRQVTKAAGPSCHPLQNDVYVSPDGRTAVAGSRLWNAPGLGFGDILDPTQADEGPAATQTQADRAVEDDERIFRRELGRLQLSLRKLPDSTALRVAMLHFPPTAPDLRPTPVTDLLERHGIHWCVFGHLHHVRRDARFAGEARGVRYLLVSCDHLGFRLAELTSAD